METKYHIFYNASACLKCGSSPTFFVFMPKDTKVAKFGLHRPIEKDIRKSKKISLQNLKFVGNKVNLSQNIKQECDEEIIEVMLCKCKHSAWVVKDDLSFFHDIHQNTKYFINYKFQAIIGF